MDGWSDQGYREAGSQKLEDQGHGQRWLEAISWVGQDPAWVVAPGWMDGYLYQGLELLNTLHQQHVVCVSDFPQTQEGFGLIKATFLEHISSHLEQYKLMQHPTVQDNKTSQDAASNCCVKDTSHSALSSPIYIFQHFQLQVIPILFFHLHLPNRPLH